MQAAGTASLDQARELLAPIEHIVVVMLENRSFDHMLGYLAFPEHALPTHGANDFPSTVEGISPGHMNYHAGNMYAPEPLDESVFSDKELDPPHDPQSVQAQIAGGSMSGFVTAFASSLEARHLADAASDQQVLKSVMSYTTPALVPVYDHLVRNFCVCDRWFCSIPGPTMPNRFYAVAGTTNGVHNNIDVIVGEFGKFRSLFRYLKADHAWRWYSSDPGILRAVDERYMFDTENDSFAYFDEHTNVQPRSFLRDALGGSERAPELPAVSWIDPNFATHKHLPTLPPGMDGPGSNDDHPPVSVINGQKLVNKIYEALGRSEYWHNSLLVVMYDEHGGFFDHVPPPGGLGPRIPVLLVSAHIKRGVCSTFFHHASVIKTILLRFGEVDSLDRMPISVRNAADLSVALRQDGQLLAFSPVPSAGLATIDAGDLTPTFLSGTGSTLARAIFFADEDLTDLQRDIIQGIAIPLRSGFKFLRRAREHPILRPLVPIFRRLRLPGKKRLEPRRP